MPLIKPPLDAEPVIYDEEGPALTEEQFKFIQDRLINFSTWKCHVCGAISGGISGRCNYCFGRKGIITLKP